MKVETFCQIREGGKILRAREKWKTRFLAIGVGMVNPFSFFGVLTFTPLRFAGCNFVEMTATWPNLALQLAVYPEHMFIQTFPNCRSIAKC